MHKRFWQRGTINGFPRKTSRPRHAACSQGRQRGLSGLPARPGSGHQRPEPRAQPPGRPPGPRGSRQARAASPSCQGPGSLLASPPARPAAPARRARRGGGFRGERGREGVPPPRPPTPALPGRRVCLAGRPQRQPAGPAPPRLASPPRSAPSLPSLPSALSLAPISVRPGTLSPRGVSEGRWLLRAAWLLPLVTAFTFCLNSSSI